MSVKAILFILCFALCATVSAQLSIIKQAPYIIVSVTPADDLPVDKVRIIGKVVNAQMEPIANAEVYIMGEDGMSKTNKEGNYELFLHEDDTAIYCYSPGYKEVLVDGYDFKAGTNVTIDFYLGQQIEIIDPVVPEVVPDVALKPVIYCYSHKALSAHIGLTVKGALTFSYPAYQDEWEVEVDSKGMLDKKSKRAFPYLFWEGEIDSLSFLKQNEHYLGTVVARDTLVSFMENELNAMGLNRTEITDFITFWIPRMMPYKYVLIQFLINDLYTAHVAAINIQPKPDNLLRVYLLFKGFNTQPNIKTIPQQFEKASRNGFTVIEWGGTQLK